MTIKELINEAALQDYAADHQLTTTAAVLRSITGISGHSMRLTVKPSDGREHVSIYILDGVIQASDEKASALIPTIVRALDVGGHAFLWTFCSDRTEFRAATFQDHRFHPVAAEELSCLPTTLPLLFEAESQTIVGCAWPSAGVGILQDGRLCDVEVSPLCICFAAAQVPTLSPELMSDPDIRQKHVNYRLPWDYAMTLIQSCKQYTFDQGGDWICDGFELVRQGVIRDHDLKPLDPLIGKPASIGLTDLLDVADDKTLRRERDLPFRPTPADYAAQVMPVYMSYLAWLGNQPPRPLGDANMADVLIKRFMEWLLPALIDPKGKRPSSVLLSPSAVRRMARQLRPSPRRRA